MSNKAHKEITKLDESFGTYSNSSNVNENATVTSRSEDDKTHPLDNDLSLDVGQPSTNDAPEQYSTFRKTPTKEQNRISDEIVAADSGESIVKEAKSFHEPIYEVADQIGDEIEGEYPEFLSEVQDRAEEFVNRAKEDPAATLKEVGKGILMVAGAMAILKGLFRRH